MIVVRRDSICRAGMVHCVRKCLENVNLCHRCNHDRGCNDSEDGCVGNSQETGRDRRDKDAAGAGDLVRLDEVIEGCYDCLAVADGLHPWVGWDLQHRAVGYRLEDFCCWLGKSLEICS